MSIRLGDKILSGYCSIDQEAITDELSKKENLLSAGNNISIDRTDPNNPIISSTSSGSGVPEGGQINQVLTKNSDTDGDASWKDPQAKIDFSGYLFQELCFNIPIDNINLIPLNNPGQTTGVIVENADTKFPDAWNKLIEYKNKSIAGDIVYDNFNKSQDDYDNELIRTTIYDEDEVTVLKQGFCSFYVIDEENKSVRFPFKGDSFNRGQVDGEDYDTLDQIRNIEGSFGFVGAGSARLYGRNMAGALYIKEAKTGGNQVNSTSNGTNMVETIGFDSSRVVPTGNENQPRSQGKFYYLVVGNSFSEISIVNLQQDLDNYSNNVIKPEIIEEGEKWVDNIRGILGTWYSSSRTNLPYGLLKADGLNHSNDLNMDYTEENFPDLWTALENGNIKSVDLETFDNLLQINGWCGVFGFDKNGTYFKTPKVTNEAQQNVIPLEDGSNSNLGRVLVKSKIPTDDDTIWYNLYSDGWVEQGGRSGGRDVTISLPISIINDKYVILTDVVGQIGYANLNWAISGITIRGFRCFYDGDTSDPTEFSWEVKGYANSNDLDLSHNTSYFIQAYNSTNEISIAEYQNVLNDYTDDKKIELQEEVSKLKRVLPILTSITSKYILNDISWLRSNTFSWHNGIVYKSAYQHLVKDFDINNPKSEIIEGIDITYYLSKDNHKICLPDQENNLILLFSKTGSADYFLLDTVNEQFKLPRVMERKLIRTVKNEDGTWYNLYSNGWVEQGGNVDPGTSSDAQVYTITFPVPMTDSNYTPTLTSNNDTIDSASYRMVSVWNLTSTSMSLRRVNNRGQRFWTICGYADESVLSNESIQYEYYYVGNFEQSAIEQTAGINAEMFNQKVDIGHQVIKFQAPSEENNYTWYRKYADGWVEQGGHATTPTGGDLHITLPIPINPNQFYIANSSRQPAGNWAATPCVEKSKDGTSIRIAIVPNSGSGQWVSGTIDWEVKGMVA